MMKGETLLMCSVPPLLLRPGCAKECIVLVQVHNGNPAGEEDVAVFLTVSVKIVVRKEDFQKDCVKCHQ